MLIICISKPLLGYICRLLVSVELPINDCCSGVTGSINDHVVEVRSQLNLDQKLRGLSSEEK